VTNQMGENHHLALNRLRLSHFRSHRLNEIAVDDRPVVLFGPNGAGKTNILEVISLLSPGRGLRRAAPDEMARMPDAIGWKTSAALVSPSGPHEIEMTSDGSSGRQITLDGKPAAQLALGQVARILWVVPVMDRLWLEGAADRRLFLDRLVMSFTPEHAEASVAYERAMRERNRLLKEQSRDAAWYEALEAQMAGAGAAIGTNRAMALARLAAAQEGSETAFPAAELRILPAEGAPEPSEAGLRTALARGRAADLAAGRTPIGPHRDDLRAVYADKGMEARLCSTGEQKALLISIILANARALAQDFGAAPILLLDEVGAHLDAERRAALYDEICALGAQAWMTGTGPELFQHLGDRAQWFAVAEGSDGSVLSEEAPHV
jgi:DNA replication and repair protein RecF